MIDSARQKGRVMVDKTRRGARLGNLIFGSDFWDPYRKRNSDSVFDSEDSSRNFFFECPC